MSKKYSLILIFLVSWLYGSSVTWNQLGNMPVNASRVCFGATYLHYIICTDDGMVFYNISNHESTYYTYGGLPVHGVAYLGPSQVVVAMGDGTYSDGIWSFDWETQQFDVIEWIISPTFLYFDDMTHKYWVGSAGGGLFESEDGLNWVENPYFLAKPCLNMEGYGEHLIVTAIANISNSFWSDDSGNTWNYSTIFSSIDDMRFSGFGLLYGIFPGFSNSSGLWKSMDYGDTWQYEFFSDNMSAVGFDCFGDCFVGWESETGIARYDPDAPPPGLTFLNAGLPNLNINRIQLNPSMSAPALFVCTDAGVFWSLDYYLTGDEENGLPANSISVFPNPALNEVNISSEKIIRQIEVYSFHGQELIAIETNSPELKIDVSGLTQGIYSLKITCKDGTIDYHKLLVY